MTAAWSAWQAIELGLMKITYSAVIHSVYLIGYKYCMRESAIPARTTCGMQCGEFRR